MPTFDITPLKNALSTLEEALAVSEPSTLERDGTIQRFEYTVELAWKMMRRHILALGRPEVSSSPKPIVRDAGVEGLVSEVPVWLDFVDKRNLAAHIYSESDAEAVYKTAMRLPEYVHQLISRLEERGEN
ncbi:MAG: HI0074 family nucleotidyltransferase substrate-binding subunit [bacterium]|nr:HI0074 family nucleotidyltransferase substrate-binding subunit [bacterium]